MTDPEIIDDLDAPVWGAAEIAQVIKRTEDQTFHLLKKGRLDADKVGKFWTSTLEAVRFAYEIIGDDVCEMCPQHAESLKQKDGWYYLI